MVPFRLLDLPAEIRVIIYKYLVGFQGQHLIRKGKLPVRFLLTCKLVRQKTTSKFYGAIQFRFSGLNGTSIICAFLGTTCVWNDRYLKTITIPFWSVAHYSIYCLHAKVLPLILAERLIYLTPRTLTHKGLRDFRTAVVHLLHGIKGTDISRLQLVLPEWYEYAARSHQAKIWTALEQLAASMRSKQSPTSFVIIEISHLCHEDQRGDIDGNVRISASNANLLEQLHCVLPEAALSIAYYKLNDAWEVDRRVGFDTFLHLVSNRHGLCLPDILPE
ncbi:hypothetical protein DPSP01_006128 [Paraphaeosphaeria sporulosa]